jgi:hypothetical protein
LGERNGCKAVFWDTESVWEITEYRLYPVWVMTELTVNDPKDKEVKESA